MSQTATLAASSIAKPPPVADPAHSVTSLSSGDVVSTQVQDDRRLTVEEQGGLDVSKGRSAAVIASVTCITGLGSFLNGLLTVGIPKMADDLELTTSLELWPASIYALTCGCTLLLLGTVADVVGYRRMYLVGTVLQSAFTLGCGLSKNGTQLLIFRGLSGIAASFCLPSAVGIITHTFAEGQRRNMAFASMGGGQPIGFSLGLTLGGVFADTLGWRWGFHMGTILNTIVFALAFWALPPNIDDPHMTWQRLAFDIDWAGAVISSSSLAMLSFVFATLTGDASRIRHPSIITLLSIALSLIPIFIFWMNRQERLSRPALIPNSLWRNRAFTSICISVFLVWGAFNAVEQVCSFYMQYVLGISAIKSSLEFLPAPISGALTNLAMGLLVHRVRASTVLISGCAIVGLPPVLLSVFAGTDGPSYWAVLFPAMALNPIGPDAMFTIANLLITAAFPARTQALAGGVFNTVAQIGKSVGLASTAVIATRVTAKQAGVDDAAALLRGYKAGWWYCFAMSAATVGVSAWGLRNVGRVGVKRE